MVAPCSYMRTPSQGTCMWLWLYLPAQGLGPALGGPLPPPGAPPVGLDLDIPVLLKKILVEDFEKVGQGDQDATKPSS
jgi:hypothetical protein